MRAGPTDTERLEALAQDSGHRARDDAAAGPTCESVNR